MLATAFDWNAIILALIPAVAAVLAAYYARDVRKSLMTTNGKRAGQMIEETHHLVEERNGVDAKDEK